QLGALFELGKLRRFRSWQWSARRPELFFRDLRHGAHLDLQSLRLGVGASFTRFALVVHPLSGTLCALFGFDLTFDASELGVEFGVLRAELRVDRIQRLAARRRALFDFQNWRQNPAKFLNLLERGSQRAGQLGKRCLALVLGAL